MRNKAKKQSKVVEKMSTKIWELPEECIAHILYLSSPEDILRSGAVCKLFFSVVFSDDFWRRLLPSNYDEITNQLSAAFELKNLKDLFILLYRSHRLLDLHSKSISLDKKSRKTCYMLGSRSLSIAWSDTPQNWSWISLPESRFPENALLQDVAWLAIEGEIATKTLSPKTTYGAYFVYNLTETKTGLEEVPVNITLSKRDEAGLNPDPMVTNAVYLVPREGSPEDNNSRPAKREDGWMEIEIGKYQVDGNDARDGVFLVFDVKQTEELNWKRGLLIEGIELRPLD